MIASNVSDSTIGWLQALIEVNLDSRKGFADAADHLKDNQDLKSLFCQIAKERSVQASELQTLVTVCADTEPEQHSSMTAAVHRAWMDLRSAIDGGNTAVLEEAGRGEDYMLHRYEDALRDLEGSPCIATIQKHYVAVRASHEFVKAMRDRQP